MEEGSRKRSERFEDDLNLAHGIKRFRMDEESNYSSVFNFRERFFPQKKSIAQYFPNHVLFNIFRHFTQPEIIRLSHVCQHWYRCSRDNITWRTFNLDGFRTKTLPEVIQLIYSIFTMRLIPYEKTVFIPIQKLRSPIRHLVFNPNKCCSFITPDNIIRLTSIAPFLESLTLPSVNRSTNSVDDNMLQLIASKLPELRKLDVSTHTLVTNRGLQALSRFAPKLTHLKLNYCHQVTSEGLMGLLKACPTLQSLSCLFCTDCRLSTKNIVPMSQLCTRLFHMEIEVDPELENLEKFFNNSFNFRSLHLRGWYVKYNFRFIEAVRKLRYLRNLKVQFHPKAILSQCRIESPTIRCIHLSRAELLKQIEIFNCPSLEELVLEKNLVLDSIRFRGCPKLKILKFRGSRLNLQCLDKYIDVFPQLRIFELFDCSGVEGFKTESKSLEHCRILMCRDLKHVSLLKATRLTTLRIDLCLNLRSATIVAPNLRDATLFPTPHRQLPAISELQIFSERLNHLNFPRCVHLEKLKVKCVSLLSLNLSECKSLTLQTLEVFAPNIVKLGLSLPLQSKDFNPGYVSNVLFPRHRNLRMLSLSNFDGLTDTTVEVICRLYMHSLQAISFTNISGLVRPRIGGNELVGVEFNNCPHLTNPLFRCSKLRKLFFRGCESLMDQTLCLLSHQNVPCIFVLECRGCKRLRNPRIILPNLRSLVFEKCPYLVQPMIQCPSLKETLFKDCFSLAMPVYSTKEQQMTKLVFSNCEHANDRILQTVNEKARSLRNVCLHQCNSLVSPLIGRLASLQSLSFSSCRNLVRPAVRDCPALTELMFRTCPSLQAERIEDIVSGIHGSLKMLEMMGCPKLNRFSVGISNQNNNNNDIVGVHRLMLGDCGVMKQVNFNVPSGSDIQIRDCANLSDVQISMGTGNDQIVNPDRQGGSLILQRLRKVNAVSLRGISNVMFHSCPSITDTEITQILSKDVQFGNRSLNRLNILGCEGLRSPTFRHPNVKFLKIYDCKNMGQLRADMPCLQSLHLRGNNFNPNFVGSIPGYLEEKTRNNVKEVVLNGQKIR